MEEAQDNVNELRQAAFGSSVTLKDFVDAMNDTDDTDSSVGDPGMEGISTGGGTDAASADSASAQAGADVGMPALFGSVNLFA